MSKEKLVQNTFFFTLALAIQKAISFVYFIFIARAISVEDLGKYSFALSFSTIFAMFLDFGMAQVLVRESARDKNNSQKYLSNVLGIKLIASIFVYLLVVVTVNLMGYPALTKKLVYVSGLVMVLDSFGLIFYSVLRGLQNLIFESRGVILNQIIILIIGLLVLKLKLGLAILIGVYFIGSLFNLIYAASLLGFKYQVWPKPQVAKAMVVKIFKLSLPFAIAGIFIRLYSYMDVVLLSKLTNDEAVGIYSVAYKVAFALQFIGVAFSAAIYPAFCKYFVSSQELLAKSFTKAVYYLLLIALPLSVGLMTIADKVISPIFGYQYQASILPLQIMMVALVMIFLTFPVGAMLNATNRQSTNTAYLGIISIFNIMANLVLIPLFSYVGSALATLLSYILLFCLGIFTVNKIIKYDKYYLAVSFLKIFFSCLAMGLVIILTKEYFHFILIIPLGALVYLAVLYLIGGLTKNDVIQLRDLVLKRA